MKIDYVINLAVRSSTSLWLKDHCESVVCGSIL